jgi:hypothetical protein
MTLWKRLFGGKKSPAEVEAEREHMSPEERAVSEEPVESRGADLESNAHLGGIDPNRLLGD